MARALPHTSSAPVLAQRIFALQGPSPAVVGDGVKPDVEVAPVGEPDHVGHRYAVVSGKGHFGFGEHFGPATKRALAADDERIELPRQLRWALPFYTVLFVVTVWSMVAKLGA